MNKLPIEVQYKIYSFYSNRDTYNNNVDIKYKFIFDNILNEIIDVQDIDDIIKKHYEKVDLILEIVLKETKLKKHYCNLIFFEILNNNGLCIIVLRIYFIMRKLLGLKFIHLNEFLDKNDLTNLFD